VGRPRIQPHHRGTVGRAVLGRVARQIGDDLRQAVGIPDTGGVTHHLQPKCLAARGRLDLGDDPPGDLGQVEMRWLDCNSAAEPNACEVEELLDHAQHPLATGDDCGAPGW